MVELYVVRHGTAVPRGTPGIADEDRPLTADGEKELRKVARGLKRLKIAPDRIVTSPLPRARRTAEIIAERLGKEDVLEDSEALRAGCEAESIRDWLNARPEACLMIVGHDPAFSELVGLLVGAGVGHPICELEKGGVAAFRTGGHGGLVLDWIATPRMLRKMG
jgi:phosphohistidine phosphatase